MCGVEDDSSATQAGVPGEGLRNHPGDGGPASIPNLSPLRLCLWGGDDPVWRRSLPTPGTPRLRRQQGNSLPASQPNKEKKQTMSPTKIAAALKPLTDIGPGDEWPYIEQALGKTHRTLLYGPPGTGKTTIANVFGTPEEVYNIYMTEETPAAELRGHFIPKGQEWLWMHGPAIKAWLRGQRLVINEINSASGDALDFLLAVLDDIEIAGITLPTGEMVKPADGFHCIATMNGAPEDLPEALRDRFSVRFNVRKAHPDAIKKLPQDLQKVAAAKMKSIPSVRPWMEFDKLRVATGNEEVAAYAVFANQAAGVLDAIKLARAPK